MLKSTKEAFCLLALIAHILSCSTIKVTQKGAFKPDTNIKISEVDFLTQQDSVPHESKFIGTFKMIENSTIIWGELSEKMIAFAKSNQANIIKVDEYHMAGGKGSHGHLGYVKGKLYFNNSIGLIKKINQSDSTDVCIYRYEKDNVLAGNFNIDLIINKQLINIKNRSLYKFRAKKGDVVTISNSYNPSSFEFKIEDLSAHYISVNKQIKKAGMVTNNGLTAGIAVGGVDIKLVDSIEGKLEYENIFQLNNE